MPNECYARREDFVTREIAGETILVPVRGHVDDLDSIYTLNETGTLIWKLIDGKKSADQIVNRVCEEFEIPREEAAKDLAVFLHSLHDAGLIGLSLPG